MRCDDKRREGQDSLFWRDIGPWLVYGRKVRSDEGEGGEFSTEYDGVEGPRTATSAVVAQRKLVGDEERNKSSAPRSIGNNVQTLSASQNAGPKVLNSQMAALFNQSAKVSLQLSTIEEKVNLIVCLTYPEVQQALLICIDFFGWTCSSAK